MTSQLPTSIFVGRAREQERVVRALDDVRLAVVYGIGGVGKTAFVQRVAHELANQRGAALTYVSCRPGESAMTYAASVVEQLGVQQPGAQTPLEKLMQAATGRPLVLCIDDLQRNVEPSLIAAIVHIARHHPSIWLFCASREELPISPIDVDHVVSRLAPLERDDAELLWRRLAELYGEPAGPAALDDRQRTPLQIKRMFAGATATANTVDADGLGLLGLSDVQARTLAQLCAYRRDVPPQALAGIAGLDGSAVDTSLERLRARFLIERRETPASGVHDLIRHAVACSPLAPGRAEHLRCLAYFRTLPASEPNRLEMLFHAVQAGEDELAIAMLGEEVQRRVLRFPPADTVADRDLADTIDLLQQRCSLPHDVQVLRATIRGRQGDTATAHHELEHLLAVAPSAHTRLQYGALAISRGDVTRGTAVLAPMVDDETVPAFARVAALTSLIGGVLDHDSQAARQALARARTLLDTLGSVGEAIRCWVDGILHAHGERWTEAASCFEHMRQALATVVVDVRLPLAASLETLVAAQLGDAAGSGALGELFDEVLFLRQLSRVLYARALVLHGDARAAKAIASELAQDRAHGFAGLVYGAAQVSAEADLMTGQLAEARRTAESALATLAASPDRETHVELALSVTLARIRAAMGEHRDAAALARTLVPRTKQLAGSRARLTAVIAREPGSAPVARVPKLSGFDGAEWQLARAEQMLVEGALADALRVSRDVETAAAAAGWTYLLCRARVMRAEAALRLGRMADAATALAAARDDAAARGYGLEARACDVIAAALARARGEVVELRDDPLAIRLGLDVAPSVRLTDSSGTSMLLAPSAIDELDISGCAFVADLARGRVRHKKRWIDLSRRHMLIDLLSALADRPNRWVPIDEMARRVWHIDYHPVRHHSRVATAVMRLRRLVGQKLVEASGDGYRLMPPTPWCVIVPNPA